jgi:hypothetical protein
MPVEAQGADAVHTDHLPGNRVLMAGRQGTGQMRAQALAVLGDADAGGGGFAHHQQP